MVSRVSSPDPKIIVAMDFADVALADTLATRLNPELCRLKVGKELFVSAGPVFVERLHELGFEVFLDLKFHDIPNTVAAACRAAADLGVWMMNVHALGGLDMMRAAVDAVASYDHQPQLIAVTVLTSMDQADLDDIGLQASPAECVNRLSALAQQAGIAGVVCSALEASLLRARRGDDFTLVTPGIRLAESSDDDQKRVMTPQRAIAAGANYLVIGRPITQSDDPLKTLESISAQI